MFKRLIFTAVTFAAVPVLAVPQPMPASGESSTRIVAAVTPAAATIRPATVDAEGKLLSLSIPTSVVLERLSDGAQVEARVISTGGSGYRVVTPVMKGATGAYAGVMAVTFDYN